MKRIRVLIVDASSTTRQALCRLMERDQDLEVVGAVASGRLALAKLAEQSPDLVLLDVVKPDMEGLKTLTALRVTHPTLPVVMFSTLTERGSQATVDALLLGATDYVTKPESSAELERCVLDTLFKKVKSLGSKANSNGARVNSPPAPTIEPKSVPGSVAKLPREPRVIAEIVAIATSTGGPNALASLLTALPQSFATPIVVVQHMPVGFTSTLAESLRRQTGRNVREVDANQPLNAAEVWIAPGGRHLTVTHHAVNVHRPRPDDPLQNDCCPSADVLFRSVAEVFGSRSLAVVLTGMGNDGLAGCRAIRQAGGTILVQDEASSIAWGMPGQVASADLADGILTLTELAQEISRQATKRPM